MVSRDQCHRKWGGGGSSPWLWRSGGFFEGPARPLHLACSVLSHCLRTVPGHRSAIALPLCTRVCLARRLATIAHARVFAQFQLTDGAVAKHELQLHLVAMRPN